MRHLAIYLLLFVFFGTRVNAQKSSDDNPQETIQNSTKEKFKPKVLYGIASFYADKFHGRPTFNDEIYDRNKFTAACNVLPMGTWIRVTNLNNNKSVIVKVNDKLHPRMTRIVDLSRVAAEKLGYIGRGLTQVKVEVIEKS